jgi:hypothetical protein
MSQYEDIPNTNNHLSCLTKMGHLSKTPEQSFVVPHIPTETLQGL